MRVNANKCDVPLRSACKHFKTSANNIEQAKKQAENQIQDKEKACLKVVREKELQIHYLTHTLEGIKVQHTNNAKKKFQDDDDDQQTTSAVYAVNSFQDSVQKLMDLVAEFSDMTSKAKRYSRVINGLKNLLDWWNSLTQVQKASRELIGQLITSSERLISEEQIGWMSVSKKKEDQETKEEAKKEVGITQVHPLSSIV